MSSVVNITESRNKLHSAIRAAAYLNKHSHALEESILRKTIVQVSEDTLSEPVTYCASCDARTVDKCLQLLSRLNSWELQVVVKKTAEVLTGDSPKVATVPTAKARFKPSPEYKRTAMITNFSYAKMKNVVKSSMLQQENKVEGTLRESVFFNPKGSSKAGSRRRSTKKSQKSDRGERSACDVASNVGYRNLGVPTTLETPNKTCGLRVPQIKLDSTGQIVVDPSSLIAPLPPLTKNRPEISTHHQFKWPFADTVKFYEALHQHGSDFSLMASIFTDRMRSNLKRKFKSEDKKNRHLVDMVMRNGSTPSDLQAAIRQLKIQNDLKLITTVKQF